MVKKINKYTHDFVHFMNKHEGSFTIKLTNGDVFHFEKDEFNYDENYLYINKEKLEYMVKLDNICTLIIHK